MLLRSFCFVFVLIASGEALKIYSRAEWGAKPPRSTTALRTPVKYVFVHHTVGAEPTTLEAGKVQMRSIQSQHMNSNGWSDIGYSFLIGADGSIFEGRGWKTVGAHTVGFNSVGYGISMMGNFSNKEPTQKAMDALKSLIAYARANNYIVSTYQVKGHRQAVATECPGERLYKLVQGLPNYTSGKPV